MQGNGFDMASYGHMDVDRFGVLLDLWTNETAYLENKRKVLTLLLFIPDEKILPYKFESVCNLLQFSYRAKWNKFLHRNSKCGDLPTELICCLVAKVSCVIIIPFLVIISLYTLSMLCL